MKYYTKRQTAEGRVYYVEVPAPKKRAYRPKPRIEPDEVYDVPPYELAAAAATENVDPATVHGTAEHYVATLCARLDLTEDEFFGRA